MGPASTSPSGGTAAGMSTSSPGSEESIEGTGNSLDTVLEMKKIEFRGGNRWIVLQDLNGPCSLIRICNFLILSGQLTLDGPTVTLRVILDSVYQMVFENMKDDNYESVLETLKMLGRQLATGLEIDINHKGIDYFGVSDSYRIFQMLGIPVYHAWVLDPKEDGPFLEVIDRRSNNELDLAAEDQYYDLLNSFRARTSSQITENGFYQLQSDPNVPYMFMLFYNSHFSLMCKSNGSLFQLQSDVGFSLNNDNMWLRVENLHWGGNFVRSPFTRCDVQRSASRSKCLESDNTYPYHCNQRNSHHKQFDRNKPRWKPTDQPTRPSNIISNVIAGSSFNSSSAPTSEDVKAQFVEFFSLQGDRDVETQFLDFLRGFTVEGKEGKHYYKAVVALMKELGIPEMRVHYKDILSFDRDLASKLCNCFTRVKKNLNNAARIFIEDFKADLKFHCENPVVYICDMPQPDGWICLKEDFFALPGNRPVEKSEVSCGDFSMKEPKTTAVGRIVLRNLFDTMTTAFQDGMSWDGKWSISDVKVNNKLDVWIPVSYCPKTTRHTLQNDLLRVLSDVIPEYMLDDELPALFMHLVRSLREFSMIRPYGSAMLKKFSKFIVAHPSLKSALANMSFIDDIYISFQALSPRARLLLHFILESDGSLVDWTKMFKSKNGQGPPPTTPRYMSSVWDYAKAKKSIGKSGGDADAKKTVEGGVADTHEGDQQGVMHAGNPGGAASKSGGDADGKETVEGGVADVHEGDKQGVVRAGNPGGADNVEVEPFVSDLKDGVVFLRHLKQHGPQVTKVNAVQHFKNLSELHQVNSRFLVDLLPEVVRNLTYFSGRHPEFDQKTHDEVFGWINEILD